MKAQRITFVHIEEFIKLCHHGKLRKDDSLKIYKAEFRDQYTAKDLHLRDFVLSPETYVNSRHEVLLCKECLSELRSNMERKSTRRRSPAESII
jgi:hypothetical protein